MSIYRKETERAEKGRLTQTHKGVLFTTDDHGKRLMASLARLPKAGHTFQHYFALVCLPLHSNNQIVKSTGISHKRYVGMTQIWGFLLILVSVAEVDSLDPGMIIDENCLCTLDSATNKQITQYQTCDF